MANSVDPDQSAPIVYSGYSKCSKITNTKKLSFFPLFVILEITFVKKMLVYEILESGLYHENKRYICMSKCGRKVLKTWGYDSVLSPLFLFFNLIKTAAKFM